MVTSSTMTPTDTTLSVPENIEYMEYCYASNQCEVPTRYLPMVESRIEAIKRGY